MIVEQEKKVLSQGNVEGAPPKVQLHSIAQTGSPVLCKYGKRIELLIKNACSKKRLRWVADYVGHKQY